MVEEFAKPLWSLVPDDPDKLISGNVSPPKVPDMTEGLKKMTGEAAEKAPPENPDRKLFGLFNLPTLTFLKDMKENTYRVSPSNFRNVMWIYVMMGAAITILNPGVHTMMMLPFLFWFANKSTKVVWWDENEVGKIMEKSLPTIE